MLKNSYNFFVLQHCILQRTILNVFRRVQTCPDMPFKTFKKPPNLDAVVTEAILNSPLLQRKRVVLEPSLDNNNTNNLNSPLVRRKRQQHQQRKKGLRKVISGMVSSFRNVITGIIPHTSANSTSHSPDNIPLIDYVTARGKNIFDTHTDIYLGNIPITSAYFCTFSDPPIHYVSIDSTVMNVSINNHFPNPSTKSFC